MSRSYEQISALPAGITPLTGAELCELEQDGESRKFPMSDMAGITAAHEAHHQRDGSDPIGSDEVEAYAIPYLDGSGRIDSRVSDASTTRAGKVMLAADEESDGAKATASNDSRLSDARPPTAHAIEHTDGGTDPIPTATTSNSGLMSPADKTKSDSITPANIPTAGEKAALAGSYGTPGAANTYVTETDPRIESATGLPVGVPIPVYGQALATPFEPCNGQMIDDAESDFDGTRLKNLNGAQVNIELTFTADAGGSYAEISAADFPGVGLHDWVAGIGIPDHTWVSYLGLYPEGVVADTQRLFGATCEHDSTFWACVRNGDLYKRIGGIMTATGQTSRNYHCMWSHEGTLYVGVYGGDIYYLDEYEVLQPTGQTSRDWVDMVSFNGSLHAIVDGGLYAMDEYGVMQLVKSTVANPFSGGSENFLRCISADSTHLYAYSIDCVHKLDTSYNDEAIARVESVMRMTSIDGVLYLVTTEGKIYKNDPVVGITLVYEMENLNAFPLGFTYFDGLLNVTFSSTTIDYVTTTIDLDKYVVILSTTGLSGTTMCSFWNEGRGIIGGAFGSVGDRGQRLTGSIQLGSTLLITDGVFSIGSHVSSIQGGAAGGTNDALYDFDSANSPYARTSADTWGKTKTDAYKLTYYMRIK